MGGGPGRLRHAEIAGGGFAGFTAACALAQRGWSVRIHERAEDLRPGGYGLVLFANGARVLKSVGAFEAAVAGAARYSVRQTRDRHGRLLREEQGLPQFRALRRQILAALAASAERAGVEIVTRSTAVAAEPEGVLVLADGTRRQADLVVAADGIDSQLREQLGLLASRRLHRDGAMRTIVSRRPELEPDCLTEYRAGSRLAIVSPCSASDVYVALTCRADDASGRALPLDLASWREHFPALGDLLARVRAETDWSQCRWAQFQTLRLRRWSAGRVAVVGDAAHGMLPMLGQGALTAMMNALSLAVFISRNDDLDEWEARERPLTEHTQRMAMIYRAINSHAALRATLGRASDRSAWFARQLRRTANHVPTGTEGVH